MLPSNTGSDDATKAAIEKLSDIIGFALDNTDVLVDGIIYVDKIPEVISLLQIIYANRERRS